MKKYLPTIILLVLLAFSVNMNVRQSRIIEEGNAIVVDTMTVYDTITVTRDSLVLKDSVVTRYKTFTVQVNDTTIHNDTVTHVKTIEAVLPEVHKHYMYADGDVWVGGYCDAWVDSAQFYQTKIIETMHPKIALTVGPYVGIDYKLSPTFGVSFNLGFILWNR